MFVDFQEIKTAITFEHAIELLGLVVKPEGHQFRGACPCTEGGGKRSLVITPGKAWYCFNAKTGGDVIALTAHVKQIGVKDAGAYLADCLKGTGCSATVPESKKEGQPSKAEPSPPKREGFDPEAYLAKLNFAHDLVVALGLDEAQARELGIGVPARGTHAGKLVVCFRTSTGTPAVFASVEGLTLPKKWSMPS